MRRPIRMVHSLALVAVCLCVLVPAGNARECPELMGRWPFGPAVAVAATGDHAFYGSGAGLMIADVSDPASPRVVGSLTLPAAVEQIEVSDRYAYVLTTRSEAGDQDWSWSCLTTLYVVDVAEPTSPMEIGSIVVTSLDDWWGDPCLGLGDIAISGDFTFLVLYDGLHVIDVSDPAVMSEVGRLEAGWYGHDRLSVDLLEGTAIVAHERTLSIIEISDPLSPVMIASLETPEHLMRSNDIVVDRGFAYLAVERNGDGPDGPYGGLQVVDIRDVSSPVWVQHIETGRRGAAVTVSEGHLYLAEESTRLYGSWNRPAAPAQLRVFDLSVPASPIETSTFESPDDVDSIITAGSHAYVAARYAGLRVLDLSDPSLPSEAGFIDTPDGGPFSVSDGYAYVVDGPLEYWPHSTLWVVNLSTPNRPVLVTSTSISAAGNLRASGDRLYISSSTEGLKVLDISNPSSPAEVGEWAPTWLERSGALAVSGEHVYLVADCCLIAVDASDPSSPVQVDGVAFPDCARDVAVSDGFAYVAAGTAGIRVVDVRTPSSILEVACCLNPTHHADGIAADGDVAFVPWRMMWSSGVDLIDVHDPLLPLHAGGFDGILVAANERYAYLNPDCEACCTPQLRVYDVRDPTQPHEVGSEVLSDCPVGGVASANRLYLNERDVGLSIFDVRGCGEPWRDPLPPADK